MVKHFLEANSKEEMMQKQLENNLKRQMYFDYSDPIKDGSKWICWYNDDLMKSGFKNDN